MCIFSFREEYHSERTIYIVFDCTQEQKTFKNWKDKKKL